MNYNYISFNAGPSYLSEESLNALHEVVSSGFLSVSHRSDQFTEISRQAIEGLREKMGIPKSFHILYHPSSTVIWDTIIQNLVQKKSYHFICGEFSRRFYDTSHDLGLEALTFNSPIGKVIDWQKAIIPKDCEMITITHNETRSGLMWPIEVIKEIKESSPHSLMAVDVCSSFGGMKMDWEAADIWLGSVQKCLSMPAGLGYLIINEKAVEKAKSVRRNIPEWRRLDIMIEQMKKYQIFETPNSLAIGCLAILMRSFDLEKTDKDTRRKADFLFNCDLNWEPLIKDPEWRSLTTPHFLVDDADKWHKQALEHGFQLGPMFGEYAKKGFRIANFPSHTYEIMERLVQSLKPLSTKELASS